MHLALDLDTLRRANNLRELRQSAPALTDQVDTTLDLLVAASRLLENAERGDVNLDDERSHLSELFADILSAVERLANRAGIDLTQATVKRWNEVSQRDRSRLRLLTTRFGVEVMELADTEDDGA